MEEAGLGLVGHRAGEPRLAGARRAMQQDALRWVDAEALEQFGMAQGQLHHLADLVDGIAEAADIVIGDVGPPAVLRLLEERPQLDLGALRDEDDAARLRRYHDQADLLQPIGRPFEIGTQLWRDARVGRRARLGRGRDDIARDEGPAQQSAAQGLARALQANILLGRRHHDAGGWPDLGGADLDVVTARRPRVDALQPVEPDEVQALVLLVGADRNRGGVALADDLDDVALAQTELGQRRMPEPGDAAPRILGARIGDLQSQGLPFGFGHLNSRAARPT